MLSCQLPVHDLSFCCHLSFFVICHCPVAIFVMMHEFSDGTMFLSCSDYFNIEQSNNLTMPPLEGEEDEEDEDKDKQDKDDIENQDGQEETSGQGASDTATNEKPLDAAANATITKPPNQEASPQAEPAGTLTRSQRSAAKTGLAKVADSEQPKQEVSKQTPSKQGASKSAGSKTPDSKTPDSKTADSKKGDQKLACPDRNIFDVNFAAEAPRRSSR